MACDRPREAATSGALTHTDYSDPAQAKRAYKFLLRPTSKQAAALSACLEDHRQLYNAALEERREAWRMRALPVRYSRQAVQLPAIRAADPGGQDRWSAGSQQQTLRRLGKAFAAFFRRIKASDRKPGCPRFRGRGWFDSIEWPAEKNGARWDSVPHPAVTRVQLLGIGHIRVHGHWAVKGRVKTITAKREGSRWYVVLANMTRRPAPRPAGDGTYEPDRAAAKAGLNRSILDAGWGVFPNILRAKAESAGRVVVAVNPSHTSQRCAQCGHVAAGNRVSQAVFRCLACGNEAHADVNAATNILRAGLALQGAEAA